MANHLHDQVHAAMRSGNYTVEREWCERHGSHHVVVTVDFDDEEEPDAEV